jgi:hypothetical protein
MMTTRPIFTTALGAIKTVRQWMRFVFAPATDHQEYLQTKQGIRMAVAVVTAALNINR